MSQRRDTRVAADGQLRCYVKGFCSLRCIFLSPLDPERGSKSGLVDGQTGSNQQKEKAFSSLRIKRWEGKGRGGERRWEKQETGFPEVYPSKREGGGKVYLIYFE